MDAEVGKAAAARSGPDPSFLLLVLLGVTLIVVALVPAVSGFLDDIFGELATDAAMLHLDSRRFTDEVFRRSRLLDLSPHLDPTAGSQVDDSNDVVLDIGETYVDADQGVEIAVTGASGGALDVSVTISRYCGNGVVDESIGELCDGSDLGGLTCGLLGHTEGILGCDASMVSSTSRTDL